MYFIVESKLYKNCEIFPVRRMYNTEEYFEKIMKINSGVFMIRMNFTWQINLTILPSH